MSEMTEKTEKKRHGRWLIGTLAGLAFILILYALAVIYIDPLFHYHAPQPNLSYPLNDERYQNDGILRNFSYDSVIIGSSMTEHFKTSEAEALFGGKFVKTPFAGARGREINERLARAYSSGHDIKRVIRPIDTKYIVADEDDVHDGYYFPEYLYNDNIFDDVNYIFNKTLFNRSVDVLMYTASGRGTTSFDDYVPWDAQGEPGRDTVLASYTLGEPAAEQKIFTEQERSLIVDNIRQNILELTQTHPETEFYYFFPPLSICYWDEMHNDKSVDWALEVVRTAIEELIECDNVKLYGFDTAFDIVCNLDVYRDQIHFDAPVCSQLLEYMAADEYRLTPDNYLDYIEEARAFYSSYDYASLHEQEG